MQYHVTVDFRSEDYSDEDHEQRIAQLEELDSDIEVKTPKMSREFVTADATSTVVMLTCCQLVVTSGDTLLHLYEVLRDSSNLFSIRTVNDGGKQVKEYTENRLEIESMEENDGAIIGTVEGDLNVDGDVYLVETEYDGRIPEYDED